MKNKTALILEGGAMRGLYTAGVLDVFMQNNIKIDVIFGVSAGALFGINYKSFQIGRVLRYNLKYAKSKDYMGLYSLLTTGNIMNKDFCFNKLVYELDKFDFERYEKSSTEFYAVATNLESGKAEYIKLDNLEEKLEYLRATGSMPFVSKPVEIDGKKYLDGAVCDAIPFKKVLNLGYEKIIVVLTRPCGYRKKYQWMPYDFIYKKYPKFIETAKNIHIKYNETLDLIDKYENDKKIIVFRPSEKLKVKRVDRNLKRIQSAYDLGVWDCKCKLDKIKKYLSF